MRSWLVFAAAAAVGLSCTNPAGPAVIDVTIVPGAVAFGDSGFSPNPLIKSQGERRVTWFNSDIAADQNGQVASTVHQLISDEGLFDSGAVDAGHSFSFTFPGAGTYHYHCLNHPTMVGAVTIAP